MGSSWDRHDCFGNLRSMSKWMSTRTYHFGYWIQRLSLGRGDDLSKGVRRKMDLCLGQHQSHPADWGCNMNRDLNLWHPDNLEKIEQKG